MKPILLLGEAYGTNEAKISAGFVGSSGIELLRMLHEAEILSLTAVDYDYISRFYTNGKPEMIDMIWRLHPEVHRTNVFNLHPPGNKLEAFCGPKAEAIAGYPQLIKGKGRGYVSSALRPELERLQDEIIRVDPNLIICFGNTALWAMAGKTGVSKLRGTTSLSSLTVDGYKLLPTYHPAAILHQWELRPISIIDLLKAKRESAYAEIRRPKREIWIEPSLEDFRRFYTESIRGCKILSVDIETSGQRVTCIGFSPRPDLAIVVPFLDERKKGRNYWPDSKTQLLVWGLIREILGDRGIKKVFQNGIFDLAFLWRAYGIKTYGAEEDTLLLHHALQPESLKGLAFLGSVYTDESAWKSERKFTTTIKRDE